MLARSQLYHKQAAPITFAFSHMMGNGNYAKLLLRLLPTLRVDLRQQGLKRGQVGMVEFGGEGDFAGYSSSSFASMARICSSTSRSLSKSG